MNKLPHSQQLMEPVLGALAVLGGSGSIDEIRDQIIASLKIPDTLANQPHRSNRGAGSRTELDYRLAWAKTYLKQRGYVKNSARGVWSLGKNASKTGALTVKPNLGKAQPVENQTDWQDQLATVLTDKLNPAAFERLVQRILRETGFAQVEVTGRTGDGGIDGKGVAKINGILSFHVVFQCKRYKGAVGAGEIRDFRGAMQGRADKGLFITTGYFTRDAIREATRDGAITIDLVDGEKLAEKLKELGLGVKIETTEKVIVDPEWFSTL
jgi:restriction system protein